MIQCQDRSQPGHHPSHHTTISAAHRPNNQPDQPNPPITNQRIRNRDFTNQGVRFHWVSPRSVETGGIVLRLGGPHGGRLDSGRQGRPAVPTPRPQELPLTSAHLPPTPTPPPLSRQRVPERGEKGTP